MIFPAVRIKPFKAGYGLEVCRSLLRGPGRSAVPRDDNKSVLIGTSRFGVGQSKAHGPNPLNDSPYPPLFQEIQGTTKYV